MISNKRIGPYKTVAQSKWKAATPRGYIDEQKTINTVQDDKQCTRTDIDADLCVRNSDTIHPSPGSKTNAEQLKMMTQTAELLRKAQEQLAKWPGCIIHRWIKSV